jgi:hypothetical protein
MKIKSRSPQKSETKRDKFVRIAQRRTNVTLRFLRLIGNLADRRNYDYTDEHVQLIFNAIDQEVRSMKAKFRSDAGDAFKTFKFGDKA